jgi:hypothetical protein
MKLNRFGSVFVVAVCGFGTPTWAADPQQDVGCSVFGVVSGGGTYDWADSASDAATLQRNLAPFVSGFGSASVAYGCYNYVAQLDAGYARYGTSPSNASIVETAAHVGGALSLRDANVGAVGIAGSRIFSSTSETGGAINASDSQGLWRVGGFGEYYLNNQFTLGLGGHYVNGRIAENPILTQTQSGFEGEAYARYYPADNISLNLRGDFLSSTLNIEQLNLQDPWNGYAIALEGEYLVPDTAFSFTTGLRYSDRRRTAGNSNVDFTDVTGQIGFSYSFGGPSPSSLQQRDRHGNYDNTSVFDEKLPAMGAIDRNFAESPIK